VTESETDEEQGQDKEIEEFVEQSRGMTGRGLVRQVRGRIKQQEQGWTT